MKASDWVKGLPATASKERESWIFNAIQNQSIVHAWVPLTLKTDDGRTVVVNVSRAALRIGEKGDSVRVSMTCRTQAEASEVMGARLLTPHLSDIIHAKAQHKIPPQTQPWWKDATLSTTRRMLEYSEILDAKLGSPTLGLVSNEGKDWVVSNALKNGSSANYGWHRTNNTPVQGVGTRHNLDHVDYSQLCRFVSRAVKVDGMHMDLDALLIDPDLAGVATGFEGALHTLDPRAWNRNAPPAPAPAPSVRPTLNPSEPVGDTDAPYIEAKNYTKANRLSVDVVCVHTMEAREKPSTAEAVAKWFAGSSAPRASAHYNVDNDSIAQSVLEKHVAWHCPGLNRVGIGIEHAGYARQSAAQWRDDYSLDMLSRSAELAAGICKRWSIPVVKLSVDDLRDGRRGFCGHVDGSKAFKKSTHTDPGEHFPWDWYLQQVRNFMGDDT